MTNHEFEQQLGISSPVSPQELAFTPKEPKIESVPVPFLEGVNLKIPEGLEVNFGDRNIRKRIKEFVNLCTKGAKMWRKKERLTEDYEEIREDLVPIAEEQNWRGIEVKEGNFGTTIFLGDSFVRVKDPALIEEMIPEEYRSQLLEIKERPPVPPKKFLVFNYEAYRRLVREGKVPNLPKASMKKAIENPPWRIKFSPLKK